MRVSREKESCGCFSEKKMIVSVMSAVHSSIPCFHLVRVQIPHIGLDPGLLRTDLADHLEARLIDDVQQVLGIDGQSVSCH